MLEGQGQAAQVTNQAKSLSEAILQVAASSVNDSQNLNLKVKLTEKYIEVVDWIYA